MYKPYKIFFLILFVFITTGTVFADTTGTLRPVADGSESSSSWENTTSVACDTVNCYEEVDESVGGSCTSSDGDTSYVSNTSNAIPITFDLDESSVPNGASVTQIDITACTRRDVAAGGEFQSRYCVDGSCSNSGVPVLVLGVYDESTQSISVDFVKAAATDIEIGLVDTDNKNLRISQISAVITYTVSIDYVAPSAVSDLQASNAKVSTVNLFWTAPGDDEDSGTAYSYDIRYSESIINDLNFNLATEVGGEPTPSIAGSSESMSVPGLSSTTKYYFAIKTDDETANTSEISNITEATTGEVAGPTKGIGPSVVKFSGQAYPNSTMEILRKSIADEIYRNIPFEDMDVNDDGTFMISHTGLLGSDYLFALRVKDADERETGILSFNVNLLAGNFVAKDLIIPPTLSHGPNVIRRGSDIELEGYAAPEANVIIDMDGKVEGETTSDINGYWSYLINTNLNSFGNHNVRAKQILTDGAESNFSRSHTVKISSLILPEADFNKDEQIDIADWSVFLFKWGSDDNDTRSILDFDNDGNVNIYDFSIFLKSFIL